MFLSANENMKISTGTFSNPYIEKRTVRYDPCRTDTEDYPEYYKNGIQQILYLRIDDITSERTGQPQRPTS